VVVGFGRIWSDWIADAGFWMPVNGSWLFSVEWVRGDKKAIAEMAVSWVTMAGVSNRNGR